MRASYLRPVSVISLLALASGCDSILGLGDFVAAEGSSSTGAGATGASSGITSSGSAPETSTSTGDVGGEGPGAGGAPQGGSGPGGPGGSGGDGGSGPCEDGAPCYDGPDGTDGVGVCRAGTTVCDEDGVATCEGQVLPAAEEDCGVVGDDDCNGEADVEDSGAACVCVPGSPVDCYTGADGTLGRGVCVGGQATCDSDGLSLGDCEGEVTPTAETCALPGDEDCDGETNEEGAGCSCTPNTTQACYSGPPATRSVGACQDGSQICAGDGTGYGACNGERVPAAENCDVLGDEDCDGIPCSEVQWAAQYGGSGDQIVTGIATASNGDVVVVGYFAGSLPFGNPSLISAGGTDVFVARFTAAGAHVWSKQFGDAETQEAHGVAIAPNGDILVVGEFRGTMAVGSTTLTASSTDGFLFKLTSSGTKVWANKYGATGTQDLTAVAVAPDSSIYVTGNCRSGIDFGNGTLACDPVSDAAVMAKIPSGGGAAVWSKVFGTNPQSGSGSAGGVAVDAQGNVVVSGAFYGTVNFGGGNLVADGGTPTDFFVARYTSSGAHSWSKKSSGASGRVSAVQLDTQGNAYVVGVAGNAISDSTVNFGGGSLATRWEDGFIATWGADGTPLRSRLLGGANVRDAVTGATVLPDGRLAIAGSAGSAGEWGTGTLASAGDAVVAVFDSSLNGVWSHAFSNGGGGVVGSDASSNLVLGLNATGSVNLGSGSLAFGGDTDVVLGKLYP